MADIHDLQPGDILHDKFGIYEGDHWWHVVVKVFGNHVDTLENNNNLSSLDLDQIAVAQYLSREEYGDDEYVDEIIAGKMDRRFEWGPKDPPRAAASGSSLGSFTAVLKEYFKDTDFAESLSKPSPFYSSHTADTWKGGSIQIPFKVSGEIPPPQPPKILYVDELCVCGKPLLRLVEQGLTICVSGKCGTNVK